MRTVILSALLVLRRVVHLASLVMVAGTYKVLTARLHAPQVRMQITQITNAPIAIPIA